MFPKPTYKKQRVKKHPPLFDLGYCWVCHRTVGLERHHIYGAANRQHSEQYGLYVDLCHDYTVLVGNKLVEVNGCHTKVTDEMDQELIDRLQQEGQRRFEQSFSREEFYRIFKRYYL